MALVRRSTTRLASDGTLIKTLAKRHRIERYGDGDPAAIPGRPMAGRAAESARGAGYGLASPHAARHGRALLLAAAFGEVVRKDGMLGAVWGDAVVTEDALTQCMVELRKALGDSARRSSVIETIPHIGFRLIPPIDRSVASLEPRLRWRLRLAVLAAALLTALLFFGQRFYALREPAPIDAVAVLPFENLSGDPALRYFSDGLAEELLNSLANVPGLRVPARTPSFAFRDANLDVRELGSRLDVDTLVGGSVRQQGPRLRVTVQLIEAGSGPHRWSEVYEGDAGDLFSLQERIARNVAEASGLDRQQLGTPPAVDIEAYDWYLLGRQHLREKVSRRHFGDWIEPSRRYF